MKGIEYEFVDRPSHPFDLRPGKSWGDVVSTSETDLEVEELPVQVSVLVHKGWFAGLRGPSRLLDAIWNHYANEALDVFAPRNARG